MRTIIPHGAKFVIELPVRDEISDFNRSNQIENNIKESFSCSSVLIVDDEASILKSLSGILSDEGFEILTASNGYEGLKTLEAASPDLVLLDIWMPGIDGIDTLKEIKKNFPATQVIMITGHGTFETAVSPPKSARLILLKNRFPSTR